MGGDLGVGIFSMSIRMILRVGVHRWKWVRVFFGICLLFRLITFTFLRCFIVKVFIDYFNYISEINGN
jgi:hypothetical protein